MSGGLACCEPVTFSYRVAVRVRSWRIGLALWNTTGAGALCGVCDLVQHRRARQELSGLLVAGRRAPTMTRSAPDDDDGRDASADDDPRTDRTLRCRPL